MKIGCVLILEILCTSFLFILRMVQTTFFEESAGATIHTKEIVPYVLHMHIQFLLKLSFQSNKITKWLYKVISYIHTING